MKVSTAKKYSDILLAIKASGKSIIQYCKDNGISYDSITGTMYNLKRQGVLRDDEIKLLSLYNTITKKEEAVDNNDISEGCVERNESGEIVSYRYRIYKKNKPVLDGRFTPDEMYIIYRLYTWYGDGLTARVVSRHFPELSLPDFKRILKAFNIYKDNCPFPQHYVEKYSEEELREIQLREKENSFLRKAEEDAIKNNEKLLRKYAQENIELKRLLKKRKDLIDYIQSSQIILNDPIKIENEVDISPNLVIFLSDLHIGAYNERYGYIQLEEYNADEITRRLNKILLSIKDKKYNSIVVCNLGDSVDSYNRQTVRGGHELPTIISNKEQSQLYLKILLEFFNSLVEISKGITYICVGESNHDGDWGWINNIVLAEKLKSLFGIKSYISNNPIDSFDIDEVSIVYLHGKDNKNQFKGFPLTLDPKTESWFNSYFIDSGKTFKKRKCVVKGDLHQYAYTCAKHFDYISAPSLYGSSSWITANFGKTPWGCLIMEVDHDNIKTSIIKE